MTNDEILDLANAHFQDRKKNTLPTFTFMTTDEELLTFARLIEQATREADIAIAHDFVQYHMDFDKADECAKEMRSQK